MPYLIALGVIVVAIAVAIFKVNQWQADKYVKLAQRAKMAEDADEADDASDDVSAADEK